MVNLGYSGTNVLSFILSGAGVWVFNRKFAALYAHFEVPATAAAERLIRFPGEHIFAITLALCLAWAALDFAGRRRPMGMFAANMAVSIVLPVFWIGYAVILFRPLARLIGTPGLIPPG
jgi:hypothetical protein